VDVHPILRFAPICQNDEFEEFVLSTLLMMRTKHVVYQHFE